MWFPHPAVLGEGPEQEQWTLPTFLFGRKLLPYVGQFDSSPYVFEVFQSTAPMLALTGSESKYICAWAF